MSSIPVRKGTGTGLHLNRRNKDEGHSPPDEKSETKTIKARAKYNSKEDNGKHRPITRKELTEENDNLKSEVKELETLLRLERDKVSSMKKDLSKKDTEYKENLDDISKRSTVLESKLESYETKLLKCNIDPVTLDSLEPGSKYSDSEEKHKQALTKVRLIKERFREFNQKALQNIDNLQVMNSQLEDVLSNCQSLSDDITDTQSTTCQFLTSTAHPIYSSVNMSNMTESTTCTTQDDVNKLNESDEYY